MDDQRTMQRFLFVQHQEFRLKNGPAVYGPVGPFSRVLSWSRLGVFAPIICDLARLILAA